MSQNNWIVWRHLIERLVRGKALDIRIWPRQPLVLVPATADDPLTRFGLLDSLRHQLHDLIPAPGAHQIEIDAILADAGEVAVTLDEPGNGELSAKLHPLGRRPEVLRNVSV